jgi:hypothetical protein
VCCLCVFAGAVVSITGLPLTLSSYGQAAFQDLRQQGDANPHARPRRCRQNQYPFHLSQLQHQLELLHFFILMGVQSTCECCPLKFKRRVLKSFEDSTIEEI